MIIPDIIQVEYTALCIRCRQVYPAFIDPELVIQTNGRAAGWARHRAGVYIIDLNQTYLISNAKDMIEETLPHEMAHVLVWQRYAKCAPHGAEWYAMFGALTGRVPTRLHDYGDVKVAQAKKQDIMTKLAEKALEELG